MDSITIPRKMVVVPKPEAPHQPQRTSTMRPVRRRETAADEVAKDVHHVEPAPGALVDVVDARLVGNMTALHAHPSGMTLTIRPAGGLAHKAKEKE